FVAVAILWVALAGAHNRRFYALPGSPYLMRHVQGIGSLVLWVGFALAISRLAANSFSPFLYFQFCGQRHVSRDAIGPSSERHFVLSAAGFAVRLLASGRAALCAAAGECPVSVPRRPVDSPLRAGLRPGVSAAPAVHRGLGQPAVSGVRRGLQRCDPRP